MEDLSLHPIKDAGEWRTTPNMGTVFQTWANESSIQLEKFSRGKLTATPEENTKLYIYMNIFIYIYRYIYIFIHRGAILPPGTRPYCIICHDIHNIIYDITYFK